MENSKIEDLAVMFGTMTRLTEGHAVIDVKPTIKIGAERLDVMSLQIAANLAAFLTGVSIPFKNLFTPNVILPRLSGTSDWWRNAALPSTIHRSLFSIGHALPCFFGMFAPFVAGRRWRLWIWAFHAGATTRKQPIETMTINAEFAAGMPSAMSATPLFASIQMLFVFFGSNTHSFC